MKLFAGTSGYSYKEWKGTFYPEDLPSPKMLAFYAERLPAVEINNTFYRMPSQETLIRWSQEVPAQFRFVLKASRQITHIKRLKDAEDPLRYLLKNASLLGEKLGPILFQLPPFLKKDRSRLEDFLALLPDGCRAAFEFRHPSWFDDETYDALGQRGLALCIADTDQEEAVPLTATADWGYLRLRRVGYEEDILHAWIDRVQAQDWREVFVFFKHEDEGSGPKLAARFTELFKNP